MVSPVSQAGHRSIAAGMSPSEHDQRVARNDPRLESLVRAAAAHTDEEIEWVLVRHAKPRIAQILSRYCRMRNGLQPHDADDIASLVSMRLLTKLRAVALSDDEAVEDLDKYVAALTYNGFNDFMRRRYPERTRLKNRLRYLLTHDAGLAVWATESGAVAGLARWRGAENAASDVGIEPAEATQVMLDRNRPAAALRAIFDRVGRPVMLDALVTFTAALWQFFDETPVAAPDEAFPVQQDLEVSRLETRDLLRMLWREIRELRPMQRKALLLNLRDSESVNVVTLLVFTGIAEFEDVAAALEMTPQALARIWNELPFDDLRIAEELGIAKRQQVINLRKAARERLHRRMFR